MPLKAFCLFFFSFHATAPAKTGSTEAALHRSHKLPSARREKGRRAAMSRDIDWTFYTTLRNAQCFIKCQKNNQHWVNEPHAASPRDLSNHMRLIVAGKIPCQDFKLKIVGWTKCKSIFERPSHMLLHQDGEISVRLVSALFCGRDEMKRGRETRCVRCQDGRARSMNPIKSAFLKGPIDWCPLARGGKFVKSGSREAGGAGQG